MTEPVSLAHHQALAARDAARLAELQQIAASITTAEIRLDTLRAQRDSRLYYWHEDGVPVAALARAASISRETAYKSIDRYRADQARAER